MSEEELAITDYTAAAESAKLREWGKSNSAGSRGGKNAQKPPWHSTRYNPKLSKGSPTKVSPAHPEKVKKASSRTPVAKEGIVWQEGLRSGAADPTPLAEPAEPEEVVEEEETKHEDRLWKQFQVDHEREVHELQRCLHVQQEEISDLKVKSLELTASKDVAKSMAQDLERSHKSYQLMETKWMHASENLREEQRRNALLTADLEGEGKDVDKIDRMIDKETKKSDDTQEASGEHSLEHTEEALEHKAERSLAQLERDAEDAHQLVTELEEQEKFEQAKEAHDLAGQLDEAVAERREARNKEREDETFEEFSEEQNRLAKTLVELKQTQVDLEDAQTELEVERRELEQAHRDLEDVKGKLARAPTHEQVESLQDENAKLKREVEELRLKVTHEQEAKMAEEEEEVSGEEALKAKLTQLKKDKERDHQELMMEVHHQEEEKGELEKKNKILEEKIIELEAELEVLVQ